MAKLRAFAGQADYDAAHRMRPPSTRPRVHARLSARVPAAAPLTPEATRLPSQLAVGGPFHVPSELLSEADERAFASGGRGKQER